MDRFGSALILAGGESKRMGFDKQFLEIGGRRIIFDIASELLKLFNEVIIVTNKPELYDISGNMKIVRDEIKGSGPIGGIHAGLKASSSDYLYVTACDMPVVNLQFVKYMMQAIQDEQVDVVAVLNSMSWIEPLNAFYCLALVPEIESYLEEGNRALFRFIRDRNSILIPEEKARVFSPDWNMFLSLDTMKKIEEYLPYSLSS